MRVPRSVRALLFALLTLPASGVHEGARAEAEGPPAPAQATPPSADGAVLDGVRFDPQSVRLPESSVEQQMRTALDFGNSERARLIGDAALPSASDASRGRILWLLARSESASDAVQARLSALAHSDHPLARWAALRVAEAQLAHAPAQAAKAADDLNQGWAGAPRARTLLALARRRLGDDRAAESLLRAQLERASSHSAAINIVFPLAEILIARGDRESYKQALALYRRVSARAAMTESGDRADKLIKSLLARMAPKDRAQLALPTNDDQFARGEALMNGHHYEEAIALYDKLAKHLQTDREGRCRAELEAGHALFFKRDREQAQARLTLVAKRCSDPDVKAWAHYYAASARQRTGDPKGAIAEYEALVHDTPEHSLADDALYLEAGAQQDAGDESAMRSVLERMLTRYPHGDMRAEGRFALVLAARAHADFSTALDQLDLLLAEGPAERNEGAEGRAAYWRARTLQDLGRSADAKAAYVEVARAFPLSYHAQQAIARLQEIDAPSAALLVSELTDDGTTGKLTFAWRPELDSAAFKAALELLRLGEVDLAQQELAWLGATGESADRDMLWLVAAMLHEAHAYADASQLVRARLRSYRTAPPRGHARQLWRIAYPRAYEPLIEQAATEAGVPPEFVRAVAREESSFNPEAVSSALAYGLIQLIRPTARIHARALGLPSDAEALKRPEINLRIGSHFIRELWRRYPTNPAVVPAAYNAGYFATDRWLANTSGQRLDDWVERIPYRETRRYTRRVLQSYGIYAWLDTGKLPALPATLPVPPTTTSTPTPTAAAPALAAPKLAPPDMASPMAEPLAAPEAYAPAPPMPPAPGE